MRWKPVDVVVTIFALSIGLSMLWAVVAPGLVLDELSIEKATMVRAVVIAMVSVVSVYVGSRIKGNDDD